ncbi:MarR family winged helix-turn-helix transcriptional regulator [Lentzea sp.]|uniref:MarR family winged helix-turn-helix transcriptional regulator n=1 Tax=Lentzea sp. TaxID=56099 RepID=UPI002ED15340
MTGSDLTAAVVAVYDTWMRTVDLVEPVLAAHRLTTATFQALWAISPDEDPPSMKTLAERLYCNAPNLTFMTNQLADRGLVERVVDPSDRRSRVLVLTAKGREVRGEVVEAVLAKTPLGTLSEAELHQLSGLLARALRR